MQKKIFTFAVLLSYMITFDWRKPLIISVIYCNVLLLTTKGLIRTKKQRSFPKKNYFLCTSKENL